MNETKHTPGPWEADEYYITAGKDKAGAPITIACAPSGARDDGFTEANAALIVAAVNSCFQINPDNPLAVAEALPELVEACRAAHKFVKGEINHYPRSVGHLLDAVLAKIGAKGK